MVAILCPTCDVGVAVDNTVLPNEIVMCGECRSELEVVTTDPIRLALAPEIEEDWGE
ncbi:lysine biosynthesis protein LysW [Amycolatopsis magusensis]|uniref:Alpha-aminoadipate carrier protein LysW n=1 Tax=Amycolatopsis magusensis TaxID=882444 RepID=A0ABS4PU18_9PSEU|nr:lysine biosynthesis protein LysW [Amycolatopsis magusensis]MBP2182932.1 alpha-aminoadipate carrier protein LysW [Amycolatopsis magusensis]